MDLDNYIQKLGIQAKLLKLSVPTPTVESAAEAVGTTVDKIVKSLLFLIDGQPTLVISPGTQRVDRKRLANHFKVSRKRVKLANAETVMEITGYEVGAVPPFGHPSKLSVILEPSVLEESVVFAGGGSIDTLLEISPQEILRVTDATILELHSTEKDRQD